MDGEFLKLIQQWAEKLTAYGLLFLILIAYFRGLWVGKREHETALRDRDAARLETERWKKLALELAGITDKYARLVDPESPPPPHTDAERNTQPVETVETEGSDAGQPHRKHKPRKVGPARRVGQHNEGQT